MACGAAGAEQQVPVAPGCRRQPRRFPALALPFLGIVFFSEQEEFEALLRQEQAGLCHGAAVPGLGEGRAG